MIEKKSYFIQTADNKKIWLAVGKEIPAGATVVEERPMIMPDDGKVLRHKATGEISYGHWLKDGSADDWEDVEEPNGVE